MPSVRNFTDSKTGEGCNFFFFFSFFFFLVASTIYEAVDVTPISRAPAAIYNHGRYLAVYYLFFPVEVQHVYGGHLGGRAARAC